MPLLPCMASGTYTPFHSQTIPPLRMGHEGFSGYLRTEEDGIVRIRSDGMTESWCPKILLEVLEGVERLLADDDNLCSQETMYDDDDRRFNSDRNEGTKHDVQ